MTKQTQLTQEQAKKALDSFSMLVAQALQKGAHVQLTGFGTFDTSTRPERLVRNPQNGNMIKVKAKKVAKFRPAKPLKSALNP